MLETRISFVWQLAPCMYYNVILFSFPHLLAFRWIVKCLLAFSWDSSSHSHIRADEFLLHAFALSSQRKYWNLDKGLRLRLCFSFVCPNEITTRSYSSFAIHFVCALRLQMTFFILFVCIVSTNRMLHHQRQFVEFVLHVTSLFTFCFLYPSSLPLQEMSIFFEHTQNAHTPYEQRRELFVIFSPFTIVRQSTRIGIPSIRRHDETTLICCVTKIAFSQMFIVADCDFRGAVTS